MSKTMKSKISKYQKTVDETASKYGFTRSDMPLYSVEEQTQTKKFKYENFFYIKEENFSGGPGLPPVVMTTQMMAIFDAICEADVRLVEVPIYKQLVSVSDFPPAPPEVDIVPLNDMENKIKINFYPGTVGRELEPIIINDTDIYKFNKNRISQKRDVFIPVEDFPVGLQLTYGSDAGKSALALLQQDITTAQFGPEFYVEPKIIFKSDDFVNRYEIYRMDTAPQSYSDFGTGGPDGRLIKQLNPKDQSSYTDEIQENKKYYYTFRSIDVHDNISNPSPVYEVEIVENSGVYYPIISIYEFENEQQNFKSKPFKRFLKIDAAPARSEISVGALENYDGVTEDKLDWLKLGQGENHGYADGQLFNYITLDGEEEGNRKFKFRLKSKHTGKILDLNVKFKLRRGKVNENIPSCGEAGYIEKTYPETE
mgnify:CR=1 FL=1